MVTGLDGVRSAREFTVEDLERMPDDGLRYELLDGTLLVSPAPGVWHQEVALELAIRLRAACPSSDRAWQAQRPFPVTVAPAALIAGLRRAP